MVILSQFKYKNKKQMKTIYHGTFLKLNKLSSANVETNHRHEFYGNAIYFSDNFDVANYYGEKIYKVEEDYHEKKIFKLSVNDADFTVIDAKKQPIRNIADKLKEHLKKGKNVLVKNTSDANMAGRKSKDLELDEVSKEYKYLSQYVIRQEYTILTKKNKELIEAAEKLGVKVYSGGMFKTKYLTATIPTLMLARKLKKIGFKVFKICGVTPEYANTYVIQDDKLLSKAVIMK